MSLAPSLASSLRPAQGFPVSASAQVAANTVTSPTYSANQNQKVFALCAAWAGTFSGTSLTNSFTGGDIIWSLISAINVNTSEALALYVGNVVGTPVGTTTAAPTTSASSVYIAIIGFENCPGYGWFGSGSSAVSSAVTFAVTAQGMGSMILSIVNDAHGSSVRTSTTTQILDSKTNPGDNDSYWLESPQEFFKAPGSYTYGGATPNPSGAWASMSIEILASPVVPPAEFPYAILGASVTAAALRLFAPQRWGHPNPVSRFRSNPLGDPVPPPADNPPADPVSRGPFRKVGRFPVGRFRSSIPAVVSSGPTTYFQNLAGTLSSSGALLKQTQKPLAGTLTSSGVILKQANKALAGTLSSSGALLKQVNKILAGTLTSSGALLKRTAKSFAGTLTPSGTLLKQINKLFAGTLTSSGALTVIKVALRSFGGTLSMSGTLVKQTGKALGGSLSPSGTLIRQISKGFSGVLAPTGALTKRIARTFSGALSFAGSVLAIIAGAVPFGPMLFGRRDTTGLSGRADKDTLSGLRDATAVTGKQDTAQLTGTRGSDEVKGKVS